ncbi:putative transcriptional regulator [Dehalogenimonas alkenigignens]|uniref:Putative transcriptional regulator n=1 Tax=Dehalogenimonas alkenigignens TaxID=1217799 RepID=A0A0W0GFV3_9CHLR|nr:helix-turn-helix transcriptional regulator [Dehalogenimonas alkenigignens]KTB47429.1 putative transcriptional regulator [Dehalogenimonas alkenigignens]
MTDDTIQKRFGERIRTLRQLRKLSQEELAFRAGIHRTYLGGIERGERNPALRNINALAEALSVSLSELFKLGDKTRF